MDVCVLRCTPRHIPRYMDQMSNDNKILINNLLCCFAIRVVYIQITITWDIWYMDEGFLIWIIPSMYLTHEAVIWVVLLVLSFLLSSGLIQIFSFFIIILYIFDFTTCVLLYWSPIVTILYTACLLLNIALYYRT